MPTCLDESCPSQASGHSGSLGALLLLCCELCPYLARCSHLTPCSGENTRVSSKQHRLHLTTISQNSTPRVWAAASPFQRTSVSILLTAQSLGPSPPAAFVCRARGSFWARNGPFVFWFTEHWLDFYCLGRSFWGHCRVPDFPSGKKLLENLFIS